MWRPDGHLFRAFLSALYFGSKRGFQLSTSPVIATVIACRAPMQTRWKSLRHRSQRRLRSSPLMPRSSWGRSLRRRPIRSRSCSYRVLSTGFANGGPDTHENHWLIERRKATKPDDNDIPHRADTQWHESPAGWSSEGSAHRPVGFWPVSVTSVVIGGRDWYCMR